ncbi:unnamed protein product [Effrenium voratum]|nr:unnamed protein product [Effrenium voratum]
MAMPELKAALGCKERWVGKEVLKDLSGSEEEKEKEDAAEQAEPAEPARTETAQSTEGRPARKRSRGLVEMVRPGRAVPKDGQPRNAPGWWFSPEGFVWFIQRCVWWMSTACVSMRRCPGALRVSGKAAAEDGARSKSDVQRRRGRDRARFRHRRRVS